MVFEARRRNRWERNKKKKMVLAKLGLEQFANVNKRKNVGPLTGYLILLIHPVYSSLCSNNARLEPSPTLFHPFHFAASPH